MRTFPQFLVLALLSLVTLRAESLFEVGVKDIDGNAGTLASYQGRVLLVVNVASECGYTSQYKALETVFGKYQKQGLTVLGFPCNQFGGQEPGTNTAIKEFCSATFRVTFPLFEKVEVNGAMRHPLFKVLAGKGSPFPGNIKWNFSKFLVGRDGTVLQRFDSDVEPDSPEVIKAIEAALAKQ